MKTVSWLSLISAAVGVPTWIVLLVVAGVGVAAGMDQDSVYMFMVGMGIILCGAMNIGGFVLGMIGIAAGDRGRFGVALAGLIVNAIELGVIVMVCLNGAK